MALITQKSKNTNTFRYKSFAERVNDIDLRRLALYHIGHQYEELEELNETYFHQTLKKWLVLNLTEEYNYFSKRCMKIVTLPQLIHQKDFVIDLLLERLATATNLSQQPLLELLYVLARDLRDEFYPYFQRVLDRLICLLNTQDAEQLEWTLICLAYLFKSLKPFLKRNIGVVFHAILPLLDEQRYEEHVTNFAVECFAYIARDIRDFPRFLEFILSTVLREQVESVNGCGRLLYELLRGVSGQLHSCAAELLQYIFSCLVDLEKKNTEAQNLLLSEIVQHTLQLLLRFLEAEQCAIICQQLCAATKLARLDSLESLLQLMQLMVAYKEGRFICELPLLVKTLMKLLDESIKATHAATLEQLAELVSQLLQARHVSLSQLDNNRLLQKMLNVQQQREIYEKFIGSLLDYQQFELLVLPNVVAYYEQHQDLTALELLASIVVHKRPLTVNAEALSRWQVYPIHLKQQATIRSIESQLKHIDIVEEQQLLLLVLLPHLRGINKQALESSLVTVIAQTLTGIKNAQANSMKNFKLALLLLQTHAVLQYKFDATLVQQALDTLLPYASDLMALGCLQLIFTHANVKQLPVEQATAAIGPLLSQPNAEVRLISVHCLQTLQGVGPSSNPYAIFYAAACIEPNVHNYRELLLQLQKLETAGAQFKNYAKLEHYKRHAVSFLLGLLYNNFKFVWEPVLKLMEEYVKAMPLDDFWQIYKAKMFDTLEAIDYSEAAAGKQQTDTESVPPFTSNSLNALLPLPSASRLTLQQALNYRQLLWQRLPQFSTLAEVKNADLVRLFLQFVNDEYRTQLEHSEHTWNLQETNHATDLEVTGNDNDDDYDDVDEQEEQVEVVQEQQRQRKRSHNKQRRRDTKQQQQSHAKHILQTLQVKLACFVHQPNPKALHRESEMREFYLELLAGPNAQLQKLALDCLAAYKEQTLIANKEQLYALIDETKFKSALTNYTLDSIAQPQQRQQFMHYLLRVLYGKMLAKGTQRGLSAQQRKTLILRFLGQLQDEDILWFLQMAFQRFELYTKLPITAIAAKVSADFQPASVCAGKQLLRIVNLLELIRKEFAGRMQTDFQLYVLKLLLYVGNVCQQVFTWAATGGSGNKLVVVYKNVKNAALQTLVNYFGHMLQHDWLPEEMECICATYVWPSIERLPQDSIHTPTPLLKLLLLWGEQPKYQKYLNECSKKGEERDDSKPIFHYTIALLMNDKAKPNVRRAVLALVEQLLQAAETPDYGAQALAILQPYIPQILQRLKLNIGARSAKQALDKRELHILTLLTTRVTHAETCETLLQLLLPIFIARIKQSSEEIVCQIITTLTNLIKRLDKPELYLRQLAPFFEQVHELSARKMLCQWVADIAKLRHKQLKLEASPDAEALDQHLRETARIMLLLNAWDKRWVEQPDYDKRLQALRELKQKLTEIDLDLGVLVIYNCFYFLRHDKDLGLRVNVNELLKLLLPQLTRKYAEDKVKLNYLVGDVFVALVQRTIRDANENVRNEGISLLGEMARQCPEAHEVLRDLAPLGDKHDTEVDFFENMTHLQAHKHGRALQRFVTLAANFKQTPSARTLTQFLLPLASRYLLNDKHTGKHTLVDAAIETVGVICQLLPWQQYHAVLRYYLQKLRHAHEQQKQCVRIVVRILDAFHFDLSQAQTDAETLKQLKNVLTESIKVQSTQPEVKSEKTAQDDDDDEEQQQEVGAAKDEETDNLSDALENTAAEEEASEVKIELANKPILQQTLLLSSNAAKRVMATITSVLIPTLNRAITEKSAYDNKHKLNRKRLSAEREEEETLRVPIALALVKLMQKLPKELLDNSLPGVFMKVCTFLRSPLKSVRMLTRDILKKIMLTLGGSYLPLLLEHLQSLLTRGFQVHVLSVTVHGVLDALRTELEPAHIESCLHNLLEVALNDIFGDVNAEKEVDKIVAHTPEAKPSAKSYLTLHIAARNIREHSLLDLLLPFKEHLQRSQSRKVTLKIQDCFAKIVAGLVDNLHIKLESLLIFIYGTMSESIIDLLPGTQKRVLSEKEKARMRLARPDCYIIPPAPQRRVGAINKQVKSNAQANAHILIEFGLEMLHIVLKRKKLLALDYQPFLNPLLPLLRDALKSTHCRVTTYALKCFATIWYAEYDLPEQQQYLEDVVKRLFEILNNFSSFGASRQEENAQLVRAAFKAVVSLLRNINDYNLTAEQFDQLVLHIDQELHDDDSQKTICFTLLKALVMRKLDTKGIHELMKQIAEQTIISQSDYVREESRNILITYIMEYPLHKRVDQIVKFMSVQLCYSLPSGRISAIQFMLQIIKKFPQQILAARSEFLYLSLGTRLVNDEDSNCRRAVAEAIEALLSRLSKVEREPLLDLTMVFFEAERNSKPSVRELAAALLSRFINAEKSSFAERLKLVLPTVVAAINTNNPAAPGRFVRAPAAMSQEVDASDLQPKRKKLHRAAGGDADDDEELLLSKLSLEQRIAYKQRQLDHQLIQLQYCLLKMFEHCGAALLANEELAQSVDELAYESQRLLGHEHNWVRCNGAKMLTHILAHYDYAYVGRQLSLGSKANEDQPKPLDYIYLNAAQDIKSLVLDLCAQVIPGDTAQEMIDEIVKIFLYIANMLREVPFSVKQEKQDDDKVEEPVTKINLNWLVRNIRYLINKEMAKAPHATNVRAALFTLIEGLITLLNVETVEKLAPALLQSIMREMSEDDQNVDVDLRQQALRVGSRLRKRIGADIYDKLRNNVQSKLMQRRAERRKTVVQEKIHDPARAAKRRAAVQERKKVAKRLKTAVVRGKAADTKQKLKKRKRKAEFDS